MGVPQVISSGQVPVSLKSPLGILHRLLLSWAIVTFTISSKAKGPMVVMPIPAPVWVCTGPPFTVYSMVAVAASPVLVMSTSRLNWLLAQSSTMVTVPAGIVQSRQTTSHSQES